MVTQWDSAQEEWDQFISYSCSYCGELNEVQLDGSIGKNHEQVEDCSVCCRPNLLHFIKENDTWGCWATPENE